MSTLTTRRDFFAVAGGGLAVALTAEGQRRGGGQGVPQEVSAWLHIGEDGAVTVCTGKVEVGQNTRTALSQAVAEELRVPIESIRMIMGDTDLVPYDGGTYGSLSTPVMSPQLRRAAATAREMLVEMAAREWRVEPASLHAAGGKVSGGGRSAGYGELARGRKLVREIPAQVELTPAQQWKVAGTSVPKVDGREFVTGRHRYASDWKRPGMLYGKVLRPPAMGAWITAFDDAAARAMAGVTVSREGDFAGVAAPHPHTAEKALAALKAEWKLTQQPSSAELFDYLKRHAGAGSGPERGSIAEGMAAAARKFSQAYTLAYIAHVPLEPRAAVAEWGPGGKLTVWTGTQCPFRVHGQLCDEFKLPPERVRVIMPDTGSGYGGKHSGECAIEAARLAKAAGKPVKLVWTREEEFHWAYFRPAALIEVSSGASNDGMVTAWEFHNYNSGAAGIRTLYDIPHQRIQFHPSRSPLRQGSYRVLAATANHFARESHMDEIARELGLDPLEFRLKNLKDERFRAVLEAVAERIGWARRKRAPGRGFGIAGGFEKNGYVATAVELEVDASRKVRLLRIVEAFDSGAVINPRHIENQIEGAIIMGIGGALFEKIEFDNGRILNGRLARYRVPRFSDVPPIETILMDRKDIQPAGAGETPIVGIAPAIGNAIFDATGTRLRSMPMSL